GRGHYGVRRHNEYDGLSAHPDCGEQQKTLSSGPAPPMTSPTSLEMSPRKGQNREDSGRRRERDGATQLPVTEALKTRSSAPSPLENAGWLRVRIPAFQPLPFN